jgi:hypothetical protein
MKQNWVGLSVSTCPGPRTSSGPLGPWAPTTGASCSAGPAPGAASFKTPVGAAHGSDMQLHLIHDALAGGLEPVRERARGFVGQ